MPQRPPTLAQRLRSALASDSNTPAAPRTRTGGKAEDFAERLRAAVRSKR